MKQLTIRLMDESTYDIDLGDNSKVTGNIMIISGGYGFGKGILSLDFALKAAMISPIRLFANYPIDIGFFKKRALDPTLTDLQKLNLLQSKTYFMRSLDDFISLSKNDIHQVAIVDESNKFGFESRRSMSDENLAFGDKAQEIRHYNCDLVYVIQLYSQLDRRARFMPAIEYHAVQPIKSQFRYGRMFVDREPYPYWIWKWYAEEYLYEYYDTTWRVGEDLIAQNEKPKVEFQNEEGVIMV